MLNFIFAGLANEILNDMIHHNRAEISHNPFLHPIEAEIERLESMEEQIRSRLEAMKQLQQWIAEIFNPPKSNETDSPQKPEAPEGQAPETATPESIVSEKPKAQGETAKTSVSPLSQEKVDGEPSRGSIISRLQVLEDGANTAVKILKKAPLTKHFKDVKRIYELLELAVKPGVELTEMERVTRLEAATGEAVAFFQTSKLAARFNVLKEVKKIMEETIVKKVQV